MSASAEGRVLAVACGGTGGHFYPGLSLAETWRETGGRPVLFIGGHHQQEQLAIAAEREVEAVAAPAIRLPANKLLLPMAAAQMLGCVRQTLASMRKHEVAAALCMGSFASVPLGLAAAWRRRPLFLHEGNAHPGRANRLLSGWARVLGANLPLVNPRRVHCRVAVTGMPLRNRILIAGSQADRDEARHDARRQLGLDAEVPVLLAFGGSQGAQAINQLVVDTLGQGDWAPRLQLLHLTGHGANEKEVDRWRELGLRAVVAPRTDEIERWYLAADLVLCRAGGSTIAELAVLRRPAIFVPLPTAMEDHQTANARIVVDAGGGLLLPEAEATPQRLGTMLGELLANPALRAAQVAALGHLARPQSARDMIDLILAELK